MAAKFLRMDVTSNRSGTSATIVVSGDVDSDTAPALDNAVRALIADGVTALSLDAGGVTFLSSAGLSVFVGAKKELPDKGAFTLIRGNRTVDRLIELTGLELLYGTDGDGTV